METSNPNGGGYSSSMSADDVADAISILEDMIVRVESTIKSVSSFFNIDLSSSSSLSSSSLCMCPYDSRHRVPPESLFRHSLLSCSAAPHIPDDLLQGFLQSLRYPNSLESQPFTNYSLLHDASSSSSSSDLCFSLDNNDDGAGGVNNVNFFYKDCPGVVSFHPQRCYSTNNKTFLLPSILSAECEANFITKHRHQPVDVDVKGEITEVSQISSGGKILLSEFWDLRRQIEAWGTDDYPATYSYIALRVTSGLDRAEEQRGGLKRWIISNSPRFGIVIDSSIRDHLFLLLRLCLKAIRTEALGHLMSLKTDKIILSNLKDAIFACPKLVRSLTWLASQLSVLYGETNAKAFTVGMLKQSLFYVGLKSMLFKCRQADCGQGDRGSITGDGTSGEVCARKEVEKNMKHCDMGRISVSQIAAAVSALHERFLFEERINGMRFPHPLPKSQLVTEYLYTSTRAGEIRESRPNYRAVSEHDWFLWQQANNQDSRKVKTREELLAEERDYKRRRMSYRGKKVKRNPTEVLRDIIEEHMEEIIHAGGIGYNVKSNAGVDVLPIYQNSNDRTANILEVERRKYDKSETKLDSLGCVEPLHLYRNHRSQITKDPQCPSKELIHKHSDQDCKISNHREENFGFKYPSIHGNYANLHGQFTHPSEQGRTRADVIKFQNNGSADNPQSKDHVSKSVSKCVRDITNQGHKPVSETMSRGRTKSFQSKSAAATGFEDRYDPSASYDV